MMSLCNRRCLLHLVGIILFLQPPGLALAQAQDLESASRQKPGSALSQSDHNLALIVENNLKDAADRLDDCTSKGRFANLDAVPDVCNAAYSGAINMLNDHTEMGIPSTLLHSCAKWRDSVMTAQNKQDCQALGTRWWNLQDAVNRATFANGEATERNKVLALGNWATGYVARFNPEEVSQEIKLFQELNAELERPHPNPGSVFIAGTVSAQFTYWLLHHCPTELAWGLPPKEYATASTACVALEPELRRFDRNVGRLLASAGKATDSPRDRTR